MKARLAPDTRFSSSTSEQAYTSLSNVRTEVERFLKLMEPELHSLDGICSAKPDGKAQAGFLAQLLVEHVRDQFPEALEAAREWFDDPLGGL